VIIKRIIWIDVRIRIPTNEILFSNLASNVSEKKNDIKPNTGKINVNATLKPSLIFE
jgi:hypothetical protein